MTKPKAAYKRIKVISPEKTTRLIDEVRKKYAVGINKKELRKQLKAGAIARRDRDRQIAEEWFPLDEEAWIKSGR